MQSTWSQVEGEKNARRRLSWWSKCSLTLICSFNCSLLQFFIIQRVLLFTSHHPSQLAPLNGITKEASSPPSDKPRYREHKQQQLLWLAEMIETWAKRAPWRALNCHVESHPNVSSNKQLACDSTSRLIPMITTFRWQKPTRQQMSNTASS